MKWLFFLTKEIVNWAANTKTFIMKGFKRRLLKHTYGDPQKEPRKQVNCTISDRVLFNQTNNQLLVVLMWRYLLKISQMYVQLLEEILWIRG